MHPSGAQIAEAFERYANEGDSHKPICMVNLLKFKAAAAYADKRPTQLTGRQAYDIYGQGVSRLVEQLGGRILFVADIRGLLLGRTDVLWDAVAIAEYPSIESMIKMSMSDEFKLIEVHREAGLDGQLNIETVMNAKL